MNDKEKNKLIMLKTASRKGQKVTLKQMEFVAKMYEKYPVEFAQIEKDVFNATVPFGSKLVV